ncbi:unnamed protein product [Toxocara canis]|uniref:FIT family protein CG10671 n=1 Tax=Toxocara canis TaxID=6265 RepID=A0A183UT45_TOXCA|nr:unnamed protein product [Toxocara canis]
MLSEGLRIAGKASEASGMEQSGHGGGVRKNPLMGRPGINRSSWQARTAHRAQSLHQDSSSTINGRNIKQGATSRSRMAHRSMVGETLDIFSGIAIQVGRKYLLMKPEKKVIAYLTIVVALSLFAAYMPLSDRHYFVQKENALNKYGVKLGWFWTCFVVGPFVWYAARAHGKDPQGAIVDLGRIVIATGFWYFCTNGFVAFEQMTGHCHGALSSSRSTCRSDGGKWVPGFDISGHCFILIYSILIICEESASFRQLQAARKKYTQSEPKAIDNYVSIARFFFLLMLILHLLWDFELLISVLYYHHLFHKLMGALVAVVCWFVTYRAWYPATRLPPMPYNQNTHTT